VPHSSNNPFQKDDEMREILRRCALTSPSICLLAILSPNDLTEGVCTSRHVRRGSQDGSTMANRQQSMNVAEYHLKKTL
jgi:hypothetical protein